MKVTAALVVANLLAFQVELAGGGMPICEAHGLVPAQFMASGELTPMLSGMFLHDPRTLVHLGGNMVCLALFGAVVERSLGAMRFLTLYLAAGVMGALLHVLCDPSSTAPLVGASGAIFGVLAAAGALRPHMLGFTLAFASVEVWHAFTGGSGDISFGCHIGGLVAGAVFAMILRLVDSSTTEGQREPHTE